jgi:glycerol uptake facilitator-like aquaporin
MPANAPTSAPLTVSIALFTIVFSRTSATGGVANRGDAFARPQMCTPR